MNRPRSFLLALLLLVTPAVSAFAQVEKVAIRTTGISCGTCAAVSEVYLRRLAGVDAIKISLTTEAILVSYKPGAVFRPKDLRDALKKTDVGVLQFQISARGRLLEQQGRRFFVAGRDRFVLTTAPDAPAVPVDKPVLIEALLNDQVDPMTLKVMIVKPLADPR
jgi:copper chaperone CopZ